MPGPEELYAQELESLSELSSEQLDYLANLGEIRDGEEVLECGGGDDEPKLTDEEWEYVLEVTNG
jgi:hypothetical protein